MDEQKYKILPVVKRLIKNMKRQDPKQLGRVALYTVTAGIYPFLAAFLGYVSENLNQMIQIKNTRKRLFYLGGLGDKLTSMDYRYVEDASFWEKNKKALNAGNNNSEGIEGVSNRMSSSVFCDRILILDGGTVADFDTHENLMKKQDSLYYKLFMSQAENYRLEEA